MTLQFNVLVWLQQHANKRRWKDPVISLCFYPVSRSGPSICKAERMAGLEGDLGYNVIKRHITLRYVIFYFVRKHGT